MTILKRYLGLGFVFLLGLTMFLVSAKGKNVREKGLWAKDLGYLDSQGIYGGLGLMAISAAALIALLTGGRLAIGGPMSSR